MEFPPPPCCRELLAIYRIEAREVRVFQLDVPTPLKECRDVHALRGPAVLAFHVDENVTQRLISQFA